VQWHAGHSIKQPQQVKKGFLLHKTGAGIKLNSKFKTEQGNLVEY
jgi:hypothetical protein